MRGLSPRGLPKQGVQLKRPLVSSSLQVREQSVDHFDITAALRAWNRSDPKAFDQLFPLVFQELRRTAQVYMNQENPNHTLQSTELVSEAFLRMTGRRKVHWENRAQFFAFAGKMMRWSLVEHARRRKSRKRGGHLEIIPLTGEIDQEPPRRLDPEQLIDLDTALEELHQLDPQAVQIIELCYFAGMTQRETAKVLGLSRSAVQRDWDTTRRWLQLKLGAVELDD